MFIACLKKKISPFGITIFYHYCFLVYQLFINWLIKKIYNYKKETLNYFPTLV